MSLRHKLPLNRSSSSIIIFCAVAWMVAVQSADAWLSMQDDSAWVPMSVYDGAIWQAGDLPPNPINIRITNDVGQQVVARYAVNCISKGNEPRLGFFRVQ